MARRTCLFLLLATIAALDASGQGDEDVQLRFDSVPLSSYIEWLGRQGQLNLLLPRSDEALEREKVSILFSARVPESAVLEIAVAVLRIHGYTLIPVTAQPRTFKVVAAQGLASEPVPYLDELDPGVFDGPDQYVSQLIRLRHVRSTDLLAALRAGKILDDGRSSIVELKDANAIVLSDFSSNLRRTVELIGTLDALPEPTRLVSLPVEHLQPSRALQKIREFDSAQGDKARRGEGTRAPTLYADDATGRLLVEGREDEIARVRSLLALFDVPPRADRSDHAVYKVRHVDFKTLAPLVEELVRENFPAEVENAPPRIQSVAHEESGSLLFTGRRDDLVRLESLIEAIDRRRPQVVIETAIIQLSGTDSLQIGIELQTLDPVAHDGSVRGFANTQFGLSTLVDEAGRPLTGPGTPGGRTTGPGPGVLSFLTKDTATDIPALLRMIQTRADTEILSSPRLLLEDHAKGAIKVVEEQPTTSAVSLNTASTSVSFSGFVEAGTSLEVTPHIAPDGEVRLEFSQSIDAFQGVGSGGVPSAKTSRSLKTTIRLRSGQTVVLGGFCGKRDVEVSEQVPLLGDIPVLGYLFSNKSTLTEVTRIYILIRPVILDQDGQPTLGEESARATEAMETEAGRTAPWER